jgi:hypothetical protein
MKAKYLSLIVAIAMVTFLYHLLGGMNSSDGDSRRIEMSVTGKTDECHL